jgi:hypothetical protein
LYLWTTAWLSDGNAYGDNSGNGGAGAAGINMKLSNQGHIQPVLCNVSARLTPSPTSLTRLSHTPTTTTTTTLLTTPIPATRITTAALACEDCVGDDDNYDDVDKDALYLFRLRSSIAMVYTLWTSQKPTSLTNLLCLRGLLQPESQTEASPHAPPVPTPDSAASQTLNLLRDFVCIPFAYASQ